MFGQLVCNEVAVYSEVGHFAESEHYALVSPCEAEDIFHALHWGVESS